MRLFTPTALIVLSVLTFAACERDFYIKTSDDKPIKQCIIPIGFAIAEDTPDELKQHLRDGVMYWNEALGSKMLVDFGSTGFTLESPYTDGFLMVGVVSNLKQKDLSGIHACGRTTMSYMADGCITKSKVRIDLSCIEDEDKLITIVRHEIGHVLGLSDTSDFTALMSGRLERTMQHPVDATGEEISAVKKLYQLE